jgi:hypothetical protein
MFEWNFCVCWGEYFSLRQDRQRTAEEWRRLLKDELHSLFCSPPVMRIMKVKDDDMGTGYSTIIGDMKIRIKSSS